MQDHRDAVIGGGIGCVAGYTACLLAKANPTICALACLGGAAVGVGIGSYLDNRRQRLAAVAKAQGLALSTTDVAVKSPVMTGQPPVMHSGVGANSAPSAGASSAPTQRAEKSNGLVAELNIDNMFVSGAANPTPAAAAKLTEVAKVYAQRTDAQGHKIDTKLLITGHTDATGEPEFNQQLSQNRARSIADIFARTGIPVADLYLKGAGSAQPVATNETEEGRARNRRVEVLEIDNEKDLIAYSVARRQDREILAFTTKPTVSGRIDPGRLSQPVHAKGASSVPPEHNRGSSSAPVASRTNAFAFGGSPAAGMEGDVLKAIGPPPRRFSWRTTVISAANAAEPVRACYLDQPRVDGDVFRYADGKTVQSHSTDEYLPGMYGGGWGGKVGNTTLGIEPVAVLREDAVPVGSPNVYLQAATERVASEFSAVVNTFEGENGVMLRVYLRAADQPITCFDIALPKAGEFRSPAGHVFYKDPLNDHGWLQADYRPTLSQPK